MTRFVWFKVRSVSVAMLVSIAAIGVQAQSAGVPATGASSATSTKSSFATGRELFGVHCARCHGADAAGTADGPNLLLRVKGMSEAGFTSAVLQRYRWSLPAAEGAGESAAREAMMRGVLSRQQGGADMPAWESQPAVSSGVKTLYEYLSTTAR
jgi:mono/diheme cytochrome c family protein